MSTHNIGFYEDLTKLSFNYHQISSNTHLISSAVLHLLSLHYAFNGCLWTYDELLQADILDSDQAR